MIMSKLLPTSPLWTFSLNIFHSRQVEESLISLQDERGLNINIILFCCWYSLVEQGRIAKNELKKIISDIQLWHDRVVIPIKRITQQLKPVSDFPWTDIGQEVAKLSLFSEQIEQRLIMQDFFYKSRSIRNNHQKITDICKNIACYCSLLNVLLDRHDCVGISLVLSSIFTKIDKDVILRYCIENLVERELQSQKLTAQFLLDL